MVTITRNNKEPREEIMSTLTESDKVKTWTSREEEVGVLAPADVEEMLADLESSLSSETVTYAPVTTPVEGEGVLARIVKGMVAFYDRLSGPAMTERDRVNLYVESTELARRIASQSRFK